MKIYKKLFFLLIISILFLGTDISAARKSSQFPKEPEQPLPANAGIYPSPKNAIEQGRIWTDANAINTEENNDQSQQENNLENQETATVEDARAKENSVPPLNLWVIFFPVLIIIVISLAVIFFFLKKKKEDLE